VKSARPRPSNDGRGDDSFTTTPLTPRERLVLRSIAAGGTNRRIAERLGRREQTIKNQLSVIYWKLGVRNRMELALYAARCGLLNVEQQD